MVEARTYQVISGDGHIEQPPTYWTKYIPERWKEFAPRLVKLPEGGDGWIVEGAPLRMLSFSVSRGETPKLTNASYYNPDGSPAPGSGPPEQRLREQDQDGLDAEVLYPTNHMFTCSPQQREPYLASVAAYNTWLAEYCSIAPDRLIGNGAVPVTGVDDAIAELKHCKDLGLRGVCPRQFPNGSGSPKPEDDRYWDAALSLGMAVSPHSKIGDAAGIIGETRVNTDADFATCLTIQVSCPLAYSISQMIVSGVFDRFPTLRVYIAETMADWLPGTLYMFDRRYQLYSGSFNRKLKLLPSEYIARHFLFSFIDEPMTMRLREHLPQEILEHSLLWGSDFPHSVCTYPRSQEFLKMIFDGVPENVKRRILVDTPAEFFGLDTTKPLTPTPKAA